MRPTDVNALLPSLFKTRNCKKSIIELNAVSQSYYILTSYQKTAELYLVSNFVNYFFY